MKRIAAFCHSQQLTVPIIFFVIFGIWQFVINEWSWEAFWRNPWTSSFPYLSTTLVFLAVQVVLAARDLNRQLTAEKEADKPRIIGVEPEPLSKVPVRVIGSVFVFFVLALEALALRAAYPTIPLPRVPAAPGLPIAQLAPAPKPITAAKTIPFPTAEDIAREMTKLNGAGEKIGVQTHVDATVQKADTAKPRLEPTLSASLVNPLAPGIIVENSSDTVAENIHWELVMFRLSDHAFCSYATQSIGYVKPHSSGANYDMNLNSLPHAPQTPQLVNGDRLVGTISVDCPTCRGTTLIVSFTWGVEGWFYSLPESTGGLSLPRGMTEDAIKRYLDSIDASIPLQLRHPIQAQR